MKAQALMVGLLGLAVGPSAWGRDAFQGWTAAHETIRKMTAAYGGSDTLAALSSYSFKTDSTYHALHQSPGVGRDWEAQAQRRHYAADLVKGAAAFGRDMEEWSFHDIYTREHTWRLDNERRTYVRSAAMPLRAYAHVIHANPALIARRLLEAPGAARRYDGGQEGDRDAVLLDFIDYAGNLATVQIDAGSGLINRLEQVTRVEPYGLVPLVVEYGDYSPAGGLMMPGFIRTSVGGEVEFMHRLRDVRINEPIDSFLSLPAGHAEIPGEERHAWRVEQIAPGVHQATDGTYNIPVVEFSDHLVVYNASRNPAEIRLALAAIRTAFPRKDVRYAILSHHHFDRAGAAVAYAEAGVTLLIARRYEERIRSFIEQHALPVVDRPQAPGPRCVFAHIEEHPVLEDETQRLELHPVGNNPEAEMLHVAYLPGSRVLVHEGDLFRKYRHGPLRSRREGSIALARYIESAALKVDWLIGNAGVPATMADLRATNRNNR